MRRRTIWGALSLALSLSIAGPVPAADVALRIGSSNSPESALGRGLNKVAALVDQANVGLKLQIFPSGQLGNPEAQVQNVKLGVQDGFFEDLTWWSPFASDLRIAGVPFEFDGRAHLAKCDGYVPAAPYSFSVLLSLTVAAHDWQTDPADESTLYRGTRLVAADQVARTLTLTGGERDFLAASHELADRERVARERANRRLRLLLVAALITLVLASATGVVALRQRDRASDQAARAEAASVSAEVDRIVAEVPRLLDRDRSLAALLAAEAVRLRPTPAARGGAPQHAHQRAPPAVHAQRRAIGLLPGDGVPRWPAGGGPRPGRRGRVGHRGPPSRRPVRCRGRLGHRRLRRRRPHRRRPGRRDGHVLGRRTVRAGGRSRRVRRAGHGVVVLARRPDPRGVDRQARGQGPRPGPRRNWSTWPPVA